MRTLQALEPAWPLAEKYGTTKAGLALSFILAFPEVSTVIPGIKTAEQAVLNTRHLVGLEAADRKRLQQLYQEHFAEGLMPELERAG